MKKNNHGGKRPGSGRKLKPDEFRSANNKKKVSFSLRPILCEKLKGEPPRGKNKALDVALSKHYGIPPGE